MRDFEPTPQQQAVIDHRGSHLLVFAGPGTGKTETLARRFASIVAADNVDPGKILVLTFSRRAVDEMRNRVLLRLRQRLGGELALTELFIRTFHSFCARLLDAGLPGLRDENLLTPVRERLLWERVVVQTELPLEFFGHARERPQFAVDALNFIAQIKGRGMTPARLSEVAGDDPGLRDLARIYAALEAERQSRNLRDFRDLVAEALVALEHPEGTAARWLRGNGFRHVLVDEFQDSDGLQLRLLRTIAGDAARREHPVPEFCFVGDVNQSIYRFRGATPENIDRVTREFACAKLPLTTNRRSPQAVLDVANKDSRLSTPSLTEAEDETRPGSVTLVRAETMEAEVDVICDRIADQVAAGVPTREIAVLLRQSQPYQDAIADGLARRAIPVAPSDEAGFARDSLIEAVVSALRLLEEPDSRTLWLRLLPNPLIGYSARAVRYALHGAVPSRASHKAGAAVIAALRDLPPRGRLPIGEFLTGWNRCCGIRRTGDPLTAIRAVVRELRLLDAATLAEPPLGYDPHASPARLSALLVAARDFAESRQASETAAEATGRFIGQLDDVLGLLTNWREPPSADVDGVRVMTIHAAKGLEFEFVVVPQLLADVLPASERPTPLLTPKSLHRLGGAGIELFADSDQARLEESSLWYVALTRSKRAVLATAPRLDDDGVEYQLSPFANAIADRLDATGERVAGDRPLRDQLQTGNGFPAEYVAGRPVLRTVLERGGIEPLAPATPRGIRHRIARLSPSAIDRYLTCPRQFFYRDVLRIDEEGPEDAARIGEVVHAVLRRFHQEARDFTRPIPAETLRNYRDRLRELAGEEMAAFAQSRGMPLGSGTFAYYRARLDRQLDHYRVSLADHATYSPFTVLECEKNVEAEVGGFVLAGKVDRIDRLEPGGLAIRDYKSGRAPQKSERAAAALRRALTEIDEGGRIFGARPAGLNLQTLLYLPGVERAFDQPVRRLDFIYFRGTKDQPSVTVVDPVAIANDDEEARAVGADTWITRSEARRAIDDIAAAIVRECACGDLAAFPTTDDETACLFCGYQFACPGPGRVPLISAGP